MKYVNKPRTIDAIQWDGSPDNIKAIQDEFQEIIIVEKRRVHYGTSSPDSHNISQLFTPYYEVCNPFCFMEMTPQCYIIRDENRDHYVIPKEIFESTYEPLPEVSSYSTSDFSSHKGELNE